MKQLSRTLNVFTRDEPDRLLVHTLHNAGHQSDNQWSWDPARVHPR